MAVGDFFPFGEVGEVPKEARVEGTHLIEALERVVFGAGRPGAVIVTTPNGEYNALYEGLVGLRHPDHRFEWTRDQFAEWSDRVAAAYSYAVERRGIGEPDDTLGHPTQMAVFTRAEGSDD